MKIVTYNIRGLKWAPVRKLVSKEQVDMLCLQETKKEMIDKALCQALWGEAEVKWESSQQLIMLGDYCVFGVMKLSKTVKGNGFIYLEGTWAGDGGKVTIVNIYSPCDTASKRILWDQVRQLRAANNGGLWCILGDFDCIRRPSERVGVCQRMGG